ncbi:MAG: LytTR family DNA-binding domain-containing protein [Bacteroidota bacterium]
MTKETAIRVLIVDDEPFARQWLEDLLAGKDNVEIVGMAANGEEAVEAIHALGPDLVFLDVQMPGLTGIDVIREIGPDHMPVTIFVTAYDQFALKAFELAALDYLVKPFDEKRFEQSFERARSVLTLQKMGDMTGRLMKLVQEGGKRHQQLPQRADRTPEYLERVAVEMRGQIRIVPVVDIDFITASDHYAELHVGENVFVTREKMQTLEERLDPDQFFRIHRSTIVRLDCIESLLVNSGGDYAVKLKGGKRLKVSRGRRDELETRLGLNR